ncbi:MAG: hypothetical protein NTX38_10265 [Methylobacter sp.]|nr:hypothetical protein [Methylobacter sp.]
MSYKIGDFLSDIIRRFIKILDNHLFIIFFIVFIVVFGTCGIWIKPLNTTNITLNCFLNSFNTLALLTFSAPLLSVTVFDSVVRLMQKLETDAENIDKSLVVWNVLISIFIFFCIAMLFNFGSKSGDEYSWYSSSAWFLVLIYWALANIDNPSYHKPGRPDAPIGTDDATQLRRG